MLANLRLLRQILMWPLRMTNEQSSFGCHFPFKGLAASPGLRLHACLKSHAVACVGSWFADWKTETICVSESPHCMTSLAEPIKPWPNMQTLLGCNNCRGDATHIESGGWCVIKNVLKISMWAYVVTSSASEWYSCYAIRHLWQMLLQSERGHCKLFFLFLFIEILAAPRGHYCRGVTLLIT